MYLVKFLRPQRPALDATQGRPGAELQEGNKTEI